MLASPGRLSLEGKPFFVGSRPRPRPFALACAMAVLFWGVRARATPAEMFGPGPASVALAGSGTSFELGPETTLTNPALLSTVARKQVVLGFRDTRFELELELEADGATHPFPADLATGLFAGVVSPLELPFFRAGLGLFAQAPPGYLVRAARPLPEQAQFPLIVARTEALDLGVALGFGRGPVSFGGGVRLLAALSGDVGVAAGDAAAPAGVANELWPAWAFELGLGLDLGDHGALGLAFRSPLRADFDVSVRPTDLGGISLPPLNVEGIAHYEPLRLDLEASRAFGAVRLVLGMRYERWSDFPGWLAPTVECPSDFPDCGAPEPVAPGYSDAFVPRVAATYAFRAEPVELELRGGYTFVPTPVPEQTGSQNVFDNARHGIAAGFSTKLPAALIPLHLDLAFRLDLLAPRTHQKAAQAAASVTTRGSVQTFLCGAGVDL
jgi:long-subunit fatty acid transport protein